MLSDGKCALCDLMMVIEAKAKAKVRALREAGKEKWEKKSCLPKVDMCGPATVTLWNGSCNPGPTGYFLHANFSLRYPEEKSACLKMAKERSSAVSPASSNISTTKSKILRYVATKVPVLSQNYKSVEAGILTFYRAC